MALLLPKLSYLQLILWENPVKNSSITIFLSKFNWLTHSRVYKGYCKILRESHQQSIISFYVVNPLFCTLFRIFAIYILFTTFITVLKPWSIKTHLYVTIVTRSKENKWSHFESIPAVKQTPNGNTIMMISPR